MRAIVLNPTPVKGVSILEVVDLEFTEEMIDSMVDTLEKRLSNILTNVLKFILKICNKVFGFFSVVKNRIKRKFKCISGLIRDIFSSREPP